MDAIAIAVSVQRMDATTPSDLMRREACGDYLEWTVSTNRITRIWNGRRVGEVADSEAEGSESVRMTFVGV